MARALALVVWALSLAAIVTAGAPPATAITNVTVIDGSGAPPRVATVVLQDGLVAAVSPAAGVPSGATVLPGEGRFLIPGLWDMHVHLATRPEPGLAEAMMLPLFLAHGIVGVRDMGGPLERVLEIRARVRSGQAVGPRVLTPGPFLDGPGDADAMFRRPADAMIAGTDVSGLASAGVDFVKIQAGLSPDVHRSLVQAARRHRMAAAGHVPVAMTAEEVIAAGQRSIEHISPALVGDGMLLFSCSNRQAELLAELRAIEKDRTGGPAAAIAEREAALRRRLVETYDGARARALGRSMRNREVWMTPTLVWSGTLRPQSRNDDGTGLPMAYVPAALRSRWLDRRKQLVALASDAALAASTAVAETAARAVADLHTGGARVLAGTDTFDAFVLPGHSLHQELRLLVAAGLTPLEALQAATRSAAAYRNASASEGAIGVGRKADLVLLDRNPLDDIANVSSVRATIVGGRVFTREELDSILAGVREFAGR